jgi:hypothetical protein
MKEPEDVSDLAGDLGELAALLSENGGGLLFAHWYGNEGSAIKTVHFPEDKDGAEKCEAILRAWRERH